MPHLTLPHISSLFPRTFALLLSPFPLFNPCFLNFVRCSRVFATPPFPNTRKRYIPIICCNRQLEYSQPKALRKLCHSFCHTAAMQVYGCQTNLRLPIIHLSPARRESCSIALHCIALHSTTGSCSTMPILRYTNSRRIS